MEHANKPRSDSRALGAIPSGLAHRLCVMLVSAGWRLALQLPLLLGRCGLQPSGRQPRGPHASPLWAPWRGGHGAACIWRCPHEVSASLRRLTPADATGTRRSPAAAPRRRPRRTGSGPPCQRWRCGAGAAMWVLRPWRCCCPGPAAAGWRWFKATLYRAPRWVLGWEGVLDSSRLRG